jgi:hypothetical protein
MHANRSYFFHFFYQWHQFHASPALDLLRTFVAGIEADIENSLEEFRQAEFETEIIDLDEDRSPEIIRFYKGMDEYSWDLDTLFLKHYPSMKRSSALLMLYGSLENELDLLCLNARKFKKYRVELGDLNHKGIERSVAYLEKVVGLDGIRQHPSWGELSRVGTLRNCIAHANGKIGENEKVKAYIKSRRDLSSICIYRHYEIAQVSIEHGYLDHVLQCMSEFTLHISETMKGINWD